MDTCVYKSRPASGPTVPPTAPRTVLADRPGPTVRPTVLARPSWPDRPGPTDPVRPSWADRPIGFGKKIV